MDLSTLMEMLEYAALSYNNKQPVYPDKAILMQSTPEGVQYGLRYFENTLKIVFRGTDSIQDLFMDLRYWKKKIPYGNRGSKIRVHSGFIDAYKSKGVRDAIHSCITPQINKLQISGHSYGAALAVLCAVDVQYCFSNRDVEVVLFGCPRVGNAAFVHSYNKRVFKTIRVENGNDFVTKIPFCTMGFRHVGVKYHIGGKRVPFLLDFFAHGMQKYYEGMWKML